MSTQLPLLQKIGLDEKEAKVYLASLRLGKATVENIANEAAILRTTTYHQIESLMQKGLMSSYTIGKKNFYTAEAPTNLSRLLDAQESEVEAGRSILTSLLPDLVSTYSKSGDRPVIRFFPGKEGLTTMREEILQMEHKEMLIVSTYYDLHKVFTVAERDAFSNRRQNKGIKTRVLYTVNPMNHATETYTPKAYAPKNVRILPDTHATLGFDIYIYDDKLCLSSLGDELWGVMIVGKAVSDSVRLLFEIAWQASTPLFT